LCASIIDQYLNWKNIYESLWLGEFASYYKSKNKKYQNVAIKKSLGLQTIINIKI